jgi:ribosomal subunit interface protein
MDVVFVGKHVELSVSGRDAMSAKLARLQKFAPDLRRIDVELSHVDSRVGEHAHSCALVVHLKRRLVKGEAQGADPERAFERALTKVEEQLRRVHSRRTGS